MTWKALTNGAISGSSAFNCPDRRFGGIILKTDGTTVVSVVIRETDGAGDIVFDFSSSTPQTVWCDIVTSPDLYYSITGVGGSAQLFAKMLGR